MASTTTTYTPVPVVISTSSDTTANVEIKSTSKEEELYSQRKCKRCNHLYQNADKEKCVFHPGTYLVPDPVGSRPGLQGTFVGWSCCRIKEHLSVLGKQTEWINEEAVKPDCPGCQVEESHLEDLEYKQVVSKFPFDYQEIKKYEETHPEEQPQKKEETPETEEERDVPKGFHRHIIREGDTLVGISLKYNVPVDSIKKANRLFGSNVNTIYQRKDLLIPVTPDFSIPDLDDDTNSHHSMMKAFKRKTESSLEEAQFYLEQTNWDLKKAIEEWELDNNYEAEQQESENNLTLTPKSISKNVTEKKKPVIDSKDKKKRSKC